jgi:uncharacterized protein YoxC
VDDDTRAITGATLVALAGGMIAFLVMTDRGRHTLQSVGPALDDVSRTLQDIREIIRKIDGVVHEAQAMVTDVREVLPSMKTADYPDDVPYGV